MIELTLKEIVEMQTAINTFKNRTDIDATTAWKLAPAFKEIKKQFGEIEEIKQSIIKKNTDKEGEFDEELANKEYKEFLKTVHKFAFNPVSIKRLSEIEIEPWVMEHLAVFFDEPDS